MPYIVVALNKADMVDDPELLELVEMEVRESHCPGRLHLVESSPRWRCNTCGSEWGDFAAMFERIERHREEQQARRDGEALARGVMEASLYEDGWVLCPHCGYSFNSTAGMSWDGEKHVTCGTYLRLLPSSE